MFAGVPHRIAERGRPGGTGEWTGHIPPANQEKRRKPMSFKCDKCGKTVPSGFRANRVVIETRDKKSGGTEIVREEKWCQKCTPQGADVTPLGGAPG